ncbi:hypothetical protein [Staphylococcus haemolyticus]|uniref:hypothetical protein n=1 Tax=Staphylococcus haemolyticus TaxID=1283 RepID=UPI001F0B39C7|nr:hypothetical protein [Staphylococcus haemolyticus]MCH4489316.1 hypothetical protein [Staphylococcus haemolyticus]MDU0433883.1 hypothetical protein [Staphylococcus haemolyticus]
MNYVIDSVLLLIIVIIFHVLFKDYVNAKKKSEEITLQIGIIILVFITIDFVDSLSEIKFLVMSIIFIFADQFRTLNKGRVKND